MGKPVTKDSTFEEIGDVVAKKLLGQLMDGRMNINDYRVISRALNGLFINLHVDQLEYDQSKSGVL